MNGLPGMPVWVDLHNVYAAGARMLLSGVRGDRPLVYVPIPVHDRQFLACGWHGVHYAEIATMAGAERSGSALGLENTMVFGGAFATSLLISALLLASSRPVVMLVIGAVPSVISGHARFSWPDATPLHGESVRNLNVPQFGGLDNSAACGGNDEEVVPAAQLRTTFPPQSRTMLTTEVARPIVAQVLTMLARA